jgi:polyisoprenoid-binding protein YceI
MALARVPVSVGAAVVLTFFTVVASAHAAEAGVYTLDQAASAVDFTISATKIFTVKKHGTFREFSGQIMFDPENPLSTQVDLTVATASVDIRNPEHNELLKSEGFFDVARFPTMHFTSSSTDMRPDGTFWWSGDLTIRGITQRMTVPVKLRQAEDRGLFGPVFETSFDIDRTEFGIVGIPRAGGLNVSIAKKVRIHLAIAASARN